jgi:hypothetical protein
MRHEQIVNSGARNAKGYTSVTALNKALLLPNEKVSCITCHENDGTRLYPRDHGKLATI